MAERFKEQLKAQSKVLVQGPVLQYQLTTEKINLEQDRAVRKHTFGKKCPHKMRRTVLLVGETGTGKTAIINAIVNCMLGVKKEERIWFHITEKEDARKQTLSQTQSVTLYQVNIENQPFTLNIIDTPGYGDTESVIKDVSIGHNLLKMFRSKDGVEEIDAIVLVVKSSENRLTVFQKYIFNFILSLFGKDVENNVVSFFTHSTGMRPTNAIDALIDAKVTCAKDDKHRPIHYLFDNCQTEFDPDYTRPYDNGWNMNEDSIQNFFKFLETRQTKSLRMTVQVLAKRKQLASCINNLIDKIEWINATQTELEDIQKALEANKDKLQDKTSFTYEVREPYKVKVPIDASWWHWSKEATCCPVCEENCHYPGCWWVKDLSWCSVMKDNHCTVCSQKCHFTKHVKEAKRYVIRLNTVEKTDEDLKKLIDDKASYESKLNKLKQDLDNAAKEKLVLIEEAYRTIITLEEIALKKDSLVSLIRLDFLIEQMKGTGQNAEKIAKLVEIKKRADKIQCEMNFFRAAAGTVGSAGRALYSTFSHPRDGDVS